MGDRRRVYPRDEAVLAVLEAAGTDVRVAAKASIEHQELRRRQLMAERRRRFLERIDRGEVTA